MNQQIAQPLGFAMARSLFDDAIAVAVSDPAASHHRALPQEYAALPKSADKRLRAFSAGRVAAHTAMTALKMPVQPVIPGKERAPVWPTGLVGSISHSETCCIAAVAESAAFQSIGVDVEENTPLATDLIPTICTPSERDWLSCQSNAASGYLAKLIFSAKECAYKCQYPLTKALFDFDGFNLIPDLDSGQFDAIFTRTIGRFQAGTMLRGRFEIANGLIVTAMSIRANRS